MLVEFHPSLLIYWLRTAPTGGFSYMCTWDVTQLCCHKFWYFQKHIRFRLRNFSGINWFNRHFMDINSCSIICICFLQNYISCQNCHMTAKSWSLLPNTAVTYCPLSRSYIWGIQYPTVRHNRVCFNRDICLAHKHYMCLSVSFQYQCCIYMCWTLKWASRSLVDKYDAYLY